MGVPVILFFARTGARCAASEGAIGYPRFRLVSETREDEAIHRGRGCDGVWEVGWRRTIGDIDAYASLRLFDK